MRGPGNVSRARPVAAYVRIMSAAPPVLPEKILHRVLAIARVDGWSIVIVAAVGGIFSLLQGGWLGATTALLVVLAGAGELNGRRLLLRNDVRGTTWLIGAQLFLLIVIWVYAWYRWRYFDPTALWAELPALAQAEIDRQLFAAGLEPALDRPLLLQVMNVLVCAVLAFVTLLYQGGLGLYYTSRRRSIAAALLTGEHE
jgi:hypothetical protein